MSHSHHTGVVRFGPFEVDLEEGVLRKHGVRVKLQAQPFQVLVALLEKPGTVVARDQLRRRLWPDDTFVDFEHGLNAAVTRLRQALGDSAEQPRYIETWSKRGYRFTAQVQGQVVETEKVAASVPLTPPQWKHWVWFAAAGLLAASGAGAFFLSSQRTAPTGQPLTLTTFRGREINPALSPDGTRVAFAWDGEKQDNFDIYVMPVPSGAPLRLTTDPADDVRPAWSPDGRTLAFLRRLGSDRGELLLVPVEGGPEHKLREIRDLELRESPGRIVSLAWSPDGRWIAASHHGFEGLSEGISLFSLTGKSRQLTSPPDYGDHMPAFSPDGRTLAFCRNSGFSASEIFLLPLQENFEPAGSPRRLTAHGRCSSNPVWTRHGRDLLYIVGCSPGQREMRTIQVSGPQASPRTIALGHDVSEISGGPHLVYSRQSRDVNIWRAKLPATGISPAAAELFIGSTRPDGIAKYSPDGKRIAFVSSRSGSAEIWVSDADGSHPVRMTSIGGPLVGILNWSPDGQWIAFHARPEGQADLFVIPAAGGSPRRLTTNPQDDNAPSYSHDGRWIYFSSARSGQVQIFKMPAEGGPAVQLTTAGGVHPIESPDGKMVLYYGDLDTSGIWSVPVTGGHAVKVAGPTHPWPFGFAVTVDGVYYPAPPHSGDQRFIQFLRFSNRETRPVVVVSNAFHLGMSVSPDGRYILFDQYEESRSDLMLVENFRPR